MPPPSRRVAPLCEGPDPPPPSGLGVVEAKGGQGLRLGFSRTTTARAPRSTNGWARLSPRPLCGTSRGQLRRLRGGRVRAFRGGIARRRGPAFLTAGCRPGRCRRRPCSAPSCSGRSSTRARRAIEKGAAAFFALSACLAWHCQRTPVRAGSFKNHHLPSSVYAYMAVPPPLRGTALLLIPAPHKQRL